MSYEVLRYVHVLSVVGFFAAHGASIGISFKLRREKDSGNIRALLDLSRVTLQFSNGGLTAVFVSGIALGFLGNWWSRLWIWVALATLIVGGLLMSILGTRHYDQIRRSLGFQLMYPKSNVKAQSPEIATAQLASSRSMVLAVLGGAGVVFILWLMFYKPF